MLRQFHPDMVIKVEKNVAEEKFKLIQNIYEVLNDAIKKAVYDENGIILGNFTHTISETQIDQCKKNYKGTRSSNVRHSMS